jgi:hypothetical protein
MAVMSPFQFVASMTSALAWPLIVGGVLLAFRRELRRWLADRPATIKMGAFAVEWEKRSAQVAVGLAASGVSPMAGPEIAGLASERLTDISESSPAETIRATLSTLTDRVRTALAEANVVGTERATLPRLVELGVQSGVIDPGNADSVMGVAVMANLALAKPEKIGEREVTEFLALADATLFALELALRTRAGRSSGTVGQPA